MKPWIALLRNVCLPGLMGLLLLTSVLHGEDFPPVSDLADRPALPQALVFLNGEPVKTPADWTKRREELLQLFQHYVYGYLPPAPAYKKLTERGRTKVLDGKAELVEVDYQIGPSAEKTITLHVAIVRPLTAESDRPVPAFIALNKCGNQEILADPAITMYERDWVHSGCKDCQRGDKTDYWCLETLVDRGYAFVTCHVDDIDPDKDDFTDGVHPLYVDWFESRNIPAEHRWGTIGAWAWGIHRLVDVVQDMPEIDNSKLAVTGHSRRGKTALFAAATDPRIALVVPHQSGTGGLALSRNNDQETVERITRVFPHWFCKTFSEFGGQEGKLPVDQHLLVALVAPRPLLETSGLQDTWANFVSSFRGLQAASPLYEFLNVTGLKADRPFTKDDTINAQTTGNLLQYRLDTKHVLVNDYWTAILDFADLHFQSGP